MTDNSNRRLKLVGGTLLVVAALVLMGFFHYRNHLAEVRESAYFARGTQLSQDEADKLERNLKSDPDSLSDRIELLVYYSFKRVGGGGLTSDELAHRREHIFWIIQRKPSSSFASNYEASFGSDGRDS